MSGFSPWAGSGILAGARQRLAVALAAVTVLWLAVLWASLGVGPTTSPTATTRAEPTAAPPAPAPSPLRAVAAASSPAPGGGTYDKFGTETQANAASVNAAGDVAFFAKLSRSESDEALFLSRAGRVLPIARTGQPVSLGGTLTGFGDHPMPALNASGDVASAVTIEGGRATDAVLLRSHNGVSVIAQSGVKSPGIAGGSFFAFGGTALNNANDVAFLATVRRGRETLDAIYLERHGQVAKIAAVGDPAPGGGAFTAFGPPALNNKAMVAFGAVVDGGSSPGGVFASADASLRRLVAAGDSTPAGGVYARFSERIGLDDTGQIAFISLLTQGGAQGGVFMLGASGTTAVASLGMTTPAGGRFVSFGENAALAADGGLAFIAAEEGGTGKIGVYARGPTGLLRLATVGDTLAGGDKIAYVPLGAQVEAAPGGLMSFLAGIDTKLGQSEAVLLFRPAAR